MTLSTEGGILLYMIQELFDCNHTILITRLYDDTDPDPDPDPDTSDGDGDGNKPNYSIRYETIGPRSLLFTRRGRSRRGCSP